jgi:hypothetical protein
LPEKEGQEKKEAEMEEEKVWGGSEGGKDVRK